MFHSGVYYLSAEQFLDCLLSHLALTHLDEHSHHEPDLIPEERLGHDLDGNVLDSLLVFSMVQLHLVDFPHVVLLQGVVGVFRAEVQQVVGPLEEQTSPLHGSHI